NVSGPVGSRENRKTPLACVRRSSANPLAPLRPLTAASGIPAPLESSTVPARLAVVNWPQTRCGHRRTVIARIPTTALFDRMLQRVTNSMSASCGLAGKDSYGAYQKQGMGLDCRPVRAGATDFGPGQ